MRKIYNINIIMKTFIINPDNGQPVSIGEWKKEADPKRAELLAVQIDMNHLLVLKKNLSDNYYKFEEAQKLCSEFSAEILGKKRQFRCPTRKECLDLYDARFLANLDKAVTLTGGNFGKRKEAHWTCEKDTNPGSAGLGWSCVGGGGFMSDYYLFNTYLALPVTLLEVSDSEL